jgi:hypothetical protein
MEVQRLGAAVWTAINKPRGEQVRIMEELIKAGARLEEAGFPIGDERDDEVLERHVARL